MLLTSRISYENVRALQRKLYLKAKQESTFRFYTLYDKIYQYDILHHAYDRVKQNKGSSGIDRVTFESIELNIGKTAYLQELQASLQSKTYRSQPVKRVEIPKANGATRPLGIPCIRDRIVQMAVKLVIEPIFEASFAKHSYGFRPNRSAHQAIGSIEKGLLQGHAQVIDADLSKYFDTIPHNNLLRTVSEKLLDGKVIHLLKQWLRVPVIQVCNGKQEVVGGKKTRKGTPQGGVISPLLANIYLNILDRIWERHQLSSRYKARLIRYADDMVILCKGGSEMPYAILKKLLGKLGLTLNESKTCIVNSRKQAFQFLGFSIQLTKNVRTGKYYPHIEPSKTAMQSIKAKIKAITHRRMGLVPMEILVSKLNQVVRGWTQYFYYGHGHRKMKKIRYYMEEQVRSQLRYRHKLRNHGSVYTRFPWQYLYEYLKIYNVPVGAVWKPVHA